MLIFISILILLLIAWFINFFTDKFKLPYTITLFVIWILLVPLQKIIWINFLYLKFTPDLLFYIFLPVLIFESWYQISYKKYSRDSLIVWILAIFWLLLSAFVIWILAYFFLWKIWFHMPFIAVLLFWIIISATDPVAVLSIFKTLWVPERLRLLFEWESLFNDWTAVAFFFVIIEIIKKWTFNTGIAIDWIFKFLSMVLWGILIWTLFWIIFSKAIKAIHNNEAVEITLTMLLAHITFITSEYISTHLVIWWFNIYISWVIATVFASIVMWNYWRSKISPRVEKYMDRFWSFFAYLANSLIFLLMWISIWEVSIPLKVIILPILILVVIVSLARAISVYVPIWIFNFLFKKKAISKKWQHLMAWWSLRWWVALTLVFLIPNDIVVKWRWLSYNIRDVILAFVISVIAFSLLFKWTTIKSLISKLKVNKLVSLEEFEKLESQIIIYKKLLKKIENMKKDSHTNIEHYNLLLAKYKKKLEQTYSKFRLLINDKSLNDILNKTLVLHIIWIEIKYLKTMYLYNEISEHIYIYLLNRLKRQQYRIEEWENQIKHWQEHNKFDSESLFIRFLYKRYYKIDLDINQYLINRTRFLITWKVIKKLKEMKIMLFEWDEKHFDELIKLYEWFHKNAKLKISNLLKIIPDEINKLNSNLICKTLYKLEEREFDYLHANQIITDKVYNLFKDELYSEI